tara:strand:- start:17140 stop:17274 length:135 start_codon:yes stop_codon:yes gene_type:complete
MDGRTAASHEAFAADGGKTNEKAAQCAALKVVGPHGLEPWTKGL